MLPETKIYSEFIKRNKIVVGSDHFVYNVLVKPIIVPLEKHPNGKWSAENDDACYTKKAAIYWYVKNRTTNS